MDKNTLLKLIAEAGYNIGFGAKKHLATYDIVEKAPGWISVISLAVGVFALFVDDIANNKNLSATLIIIGVAGLYITFYLDKKDEYEINGKAMTMMFNRLKSLYYSVKASGANDFKSELNELNAIEKEFCSIAISKQIFLSDWYAHFKFFWQHQIEWIDEQKKFKLLRDKIPLSAHIAIILIVTLVIYSAIPTFKSLFTFWCN